MTLFEKARAWLPGMAQAAAGVSVVYKRGATEAPIAAIPGQTTAQSNAEVAIRVQTGDRDYLIEIADLAAAGFGQPQIGDQIVDCGETFEIQTPSTGEPAWRHEQTRTRYRIHVKRVG